MSGPALTEPTRADLLARIEDIEHQLATVLDREGPPGGVPGEEDEVPAISELISEASRAKLLAELAEPHESGQPPDAPQADERAT